MATINRIDETEKKRRLAGPYGGALAGAVGALAAGGNALAAAPGRAYNALASGYTRGGPPLAGLPDPSSVLAQPARPLAPRATYDMSADVGTTSNRVARPANVTQPTGGAPMGPNLYEAGSNNAVPQTQVNGNTMDLAGQNARMRAALDAGNAAAAAPGGTEEAGYRGPLAPQRGIGGDFDFATQAAADFAARQSKNPLQVQQYIAARNAESRGDTANKVYADTSLSLAQAGETTGRTKNAAALLPSEIGLKQSQAQEQLARVPLSLAQAGEAQARGNSIAALTPSQIAKMNADAGESQARSGLYGAQAQATSSDADNRSLLAPGAFEQQRQTTKKGALDLKAAQDLDALRQGALSGDPKASKAFAQYMKANAGKGDGSVTEEDIITAFVNDRKASAANPNAGPPQSYAEFKASIMGTGGAAPPKGVPEGSIAEYNGQKKVYKGGQWVDYK